MKCRIWWPKHLSSSEPPSSSSPSRLLLFGWFLSSSYSSVDVVVAFAHDEASVGGSPLHNLQDAIHLVQQAMPVSLQDKSTFSLLGCCAQSFGSEDTQDEKRELLIGHNVFMQRRLGISHESFCQLCCGCQEVDGLVKKYSQPLLQSYWWIQVVHDPQWYSNQGICWIPKLHHICCDGIMVPICDLHVVLYETPKFGGQHFSLCYSSSKHLKDYARRPRWLHDLNQKHQDLELEPVIIAVNSTTAASSLFDKHMGLKRCSQLPIICMFLELIWKLLAAMIAIFASIQYIILQFLHSFTRFESKFWMYAALLQVFSRTWKNIHIRCCQFLYWPVILGETGFRAQSCVEYAEKLAMKKHSLWSSIAVDILLGNLVGFLLILHRKAVCRLILSLASQITDNLLRSGSVWLMGVPAGFKLNTELAGVLGIISLNAIQIWSTLWFSIAFTFYHVIELAAVSGILFGMTTLAAFLTDVIAVVALHISALHWLLSLLYSYQIQALSSLWRLFRGRKWNPLRYRLDSYDYTVEQHIVGSLLFAPLLLLLPTTSVFYVFFTIVNTTVIFLLLLMEGGISVIHAAPYYQIITWIWRSARFPSGIWLELLYCKNDTSLDNGFIDQVSGTCGNLHQSMYSTGNQSTIVSFLNSNCCTLGQVLLPHLRNIFLVFSKSPITSSTYGILTGKRKPVKDVFPLPSAMPWIFIPCKDYWWICYNSVLSCLQPGSVKIH